MGSSSFVDVPVFSRRPVRPVLFRLTYHRSFLLSCQPFPESIGCRCTACPVVAAARYFSPGGSPGCGRLPPCPLRKRRNSAKFFRGRRFPLPAVGRGFPKKGTRCRMLQRALVFELFFLPMGPPGEAANRLSAAFVVGDSLGLGRLRGFGRGDQHDHGHHIGK